MLREDLICAPGWIVGNEPELTDQDKKQKRRFMPFGVIFGLLGLGLFSYFVSRVGVSEVLEGIRRLGVGFVLVLAISSIRHIVRSIAWTRCVEMPYALRFRDAFAARLMGDALGNIIPLASVAVSEPSKAVFVRHRLPLMIGLSALAIENIFYSLSVAFFMFCGTATLLLTFTLPRGLRYATIAALVGALVFIPLALLMVRGGSRVLTSVVNFLARCGLPRRVIDKLRPSAATLEDRIFGFYQSNKQSFYSIFALELIFHLAGVLEIYTTLSFISPVQPTFTQALILESVNRIINVVFKFIPFRAGVDEGGTGQVSKVLGLTKTTGVTLAIIRKGRDLFWAAIGLLLLLQRGFSLRTLQSEQVASEGSLKATPVTTGE